MFGGYETLFRLGGFIGLLVLFAVLETLAPRRQRRHSRLLRWPNNLAISGLSQLLSRIFLPLSATVLAVYCADQDWGLLNILNAPYWLEFAIALLLLDLAIYWQHRLFHLIPLLWRLHRVHHSDGDFDVSTGIRFHPLSIVLSSALKLVMVLLIGPAAPAVLVFELLLNGSSLFNHSNVRLPRRVERNLRALLVTPDMHRVHHSNNSDEMNSNFGFNLFCWDRLFDSYRAEPAGGHRQMGIGLREFPDASEQGIAQMLSQPFREPRS